MGQSYFKEQADRCRRLARDSTDPVLQVSLCGLADDYQMKADELAAQIDQDKARLVALLAGVFSAGSDRI
jgi:hypothetical protein